MKILTLSMHYNLCMRVFVNPREGGLYAGQAFDVLHTNIRHGKIDTVSYCSETIK